MPSFYPKLLTIIIALFLLSNCQTKTEPSGASLVQEEIPETAYQYSGSPLRVGVVGLVHTHVHWILGREDIGDIELVGIVEPNLDLAKRYSALHGYSMDIVFPTINEMVEATQPEAITAFNTIYGHLEVVEYCAPKGIHVMVEKPLAVSWDHAQKMAKLARENNIQLLTNYETTWYGSNARAYEVAIEEQSMGPIRKLLFHTGHPGPIEIGCNEEFLEWLCDPVLNGGGALTDFGCYGANLATWFLQGATPLSVTCLTQQIKPDKYPNVEDEATIVLEYPQTQVIIQASWNWSHNRKDMELYGRNGYIVCKNGSDMEFLKDEKVGPYPEQAQDLPKGIHDPFAYLNAILKGEHQAEAYDLSSLENNLIVMQILEAAKHAAKTGQRVIWKDFFAAN